MANNTATLPPAKRRRVWLRVLLGTVVLLVILIVTAFFIATSSAFLKNAILPRVSRAIGAKVTVSGATIHPFSEIDLRDVNIQSANQAPLVTAPEIRVRYHLWDILHGNLRVDEIALVSPTVELVENPDGSSNLDPLLQALKRKPSTTAKPSRPVKPSPPPQIDLARLTLSNAKFVKIQNYAGGRLDLMELTNVNVTLTNLKNGQTARLQLEAALSAKNNPPTGAAGDLNAAIKGSFQFALSPGLKPGTVNGQAHLSVSSASGIFNNFSDFRAAVDCDATPTEIRQLDLHFQKAGASLGGLAVSGPLNLQTMDGQLQVKLQGIDRRLLNLFGATSGINFDSTAINSTNEITLSKAGTVIAATGRFNADKFQVTRAGKTTPRLDFSANYAVTMDSSARTALLRELTLAGAQNGLPLLNARLSQPMSLAWGNRASNVGNSALELNVTKLNLAEWQPFLGGAVSSGEVSATAKLLSQKAGKELGFDLELQADNLGVRTGNHQTVEASANLQALGQATDFKQFHLSKYQLQVVRQNQTLLTASGSGNYNLADASANAQVVLQASLPGLCSLFPLPGVGFSSGTLKLNGSITQKQNIQTVAGRLALADLTGQSGKNSFSKFGSTMAVDVSRTPERIQIEKLDGTLAQAGNPGGNFVLSGSLDPARKTAQLTAKLSGFNQNGLRPFLEPLLAGKKLVSVAVNGDVSAQYDPYQNSAINADLQVTNLVVHDPTGRFPATPLAAGLRIETALQKQSADIRRFQISLTPTALAQNQIQLQGQIDFAQPKAIQGNLKLAADSLDLTRYYNLFAGAANTGNQTASSTPSTAPAASANQEPPPVTLPVNNFTVAADIGRIYLRELVITNFQTTIKLDTHRVILKPFQFALNGAPVSAAVDLNLGVPGYKYNLALDADRVPFAPLVNSFAVQRYGQLGGALTAHADITGAGITGADLQKSLNGRFDVGATNLNLSVVNVQSKILKSLINVVAMIPDLIKSPASAIASLLGQVTGQGGGLMSQLQQSPIEIIAVRGQAGNGRIQVQQATVRSSAFEADAPGDIALASVLTNSTINFPVTVSVNQPIAQQLNIGSGTVANGTYVQLPQFLTMTGTLGNPQRQIKSSALAGMAVKSIGGALLNQTTNSASRLGGFLNQFLQRVH